MNGNLKRRTHLLFSATVTALLSLHIFETAHLEDDVRGLWFKSHLPRMP